MCRKKLFKIATVFHRFPKLFSGSIAVKTLRKTMTRPYLVKKSIFDSLEKLTYETELFCFVWMKQWRHKPCPKQKYNQPATSRYFYEKSYKDSDDNK